MQATGEHTICDGNPAGSSALLAENEALRAEVARLTAMLSSKSSSHDGERESVLEGKNAFKASHVENFRDLFNHGDLLKFEEDSPQFRLKTDELEACVDELRSFVQILVDSCRRYCKHGKATVDAGREFSGLLRSLGSDVWNLRFGKVATLLSTFGDTFEEIESYREVLLTSLEETFCAPMEELVHLEVKRVRNLKQDIQKSSSDLEQFLVRYLRGKHPSGSMGALTGSAHGHQDSRDHLDAELSVLRKTFELARYDMVMELNSQKENRKFQLCQRVCASLYAHSGYFQECHRVVASVSPALEQLNTELSLARKEFSRKGMLFMLKRKLILREVKRATPAIALTLPKKKRGSLQPDSSAHPVVGHFHEASLMPAPEVHSKIGTNRDEISATSAAPTLSTTEKNNDHSWNAVEDKTEIPRAPPIAELEGLRLSRYLESQDSFDNDKISASPRSSEILGLIDPSDKLRPNSSREKNVPIFKTKSSAGEIISTSPLVTHHASPFLVNMNLGVSVASIISGPDVSGPVALVESKRSKSMKGYLWKQSNNMTKDWQRRWFFIKDGCLWYMQTDTSGSNLLKPAGVGLGAGNGNSSRDVALHSRLVQATEAKLVCNLLIATVKEMNDPSDYKFCFKVISPGRRVYVLQAEDIESCNNWIHALREEIEQSLSQVTTHNAHSSQTGSFSPPSSAARRNSECTSAVLPESTIVLSRDQQLMLQQCNPFCADCGCPSPTWASVNNCILLCIDCCGVHRSLGTHISKVRSLRLDRFTHNSVKLLIEIGNDRFNRVYEKLLMAPKEDTDCEVFKLKPICSRAERETFITTKYVRRQFVQPTLTKSEANSMLIGASSEGKLLLMLEAIAAGADVNARTDDSNLFSALHVACMGGHALAVEYLCQCNASVDIVDGNGKVPSDYIDNDNVAVIDTLYTNVENELKSSFSEDD